MIYSLTDPDTDLKIHKDMNWSMVPIFVTNFSGNASLWVQPSIFKDKVGSMPSR